MVAEYPGGGHGEMGVDKMDSTGWSKRQGKAAW